MPSALYNLAKSLCGNLNALNKEKALVLKEFLNQIPEPTDQEIIAKITTIKNAKSKKNISTDFFNEKNNRFRTTVGIVANKCVAAINKTTDFVERNGKILSLCEEFLKQAEIIIKKTEIDQANHGNSWLYQFPNDILAEIFKCFPQEELAKIATVSSHFSHIIKKIIFTVPPSPRDYKLLPYKISKPLSSLFGTHDMVITQTYLLTQRMKLIMNINDGFCVYDLIYDKNLGSLGIKDNIIRCLAQLSEKLIVTAGETFANYVKKNPGFINIWDIQNYKIVTKLKSQEIIQHLAVSSTNKFWSAGENKVRLWKKCGEEWNCSKISEIEMKNTKDQIEGIVEIPTLNQLIIATKNQILIYDIQKQGIIQKEAIANITCVQISSDNHLAIGSIDGKVHLWNKESSEQPWKSFKVLLISNSAITAIIFLDNQIICGSLGDLKKNKSGHIRALEWKKEKPKAKILHGSSSIYLSSVQGLLISINRKSITLLRFPKLQPAPAFTNETSKEKTNEEVANMGQQFLLVP